MKNIVKIILVAILATFIGFNCQAQNQKETKSKYAEVTFVTTIECNNCVKKAEANLPYQKGVKDCKIKLEDQTVYFKYDTGKTDKETLKKSIEKLGYEAKEKVSK
ncbi:MAG: heavy-metal-associated domain-containing protein [Bacteroidales bacterium]|nr:heavy-metal-associated domain-containing protein [Bacteroidales bacterium]